MLLEHTPGRFRVQPGASSSDTLEKQNGPLRSVPWGHRGTGRGLNYLDRISRYGQVALTVTFVLAVEVVQDPTVTVTLYVPGVLFVVTLVRTGFWRDDV